MTSQNLKGRMVMVTRAEDQAGGLKRALEKFGAGVIAMPTIKIAPPDDLSDLDKAIRNLAVYDLVIFTSANGVQSFFDRLELLKGEIKGKVRARYFAVGPKTSDALKTRGVSVEKLPRKFTGADLAAVLVEQGVVGLRILMPRANIATGELPGALREAGAIVDDIPAYKTVQDDSDATEQLRLLAEGRVDCITFTSASTVSNFLKRTSTVSGSLFKNSLIACIGPMTVRAAVSFGLHVDIVPEKATVEDLADAVAEYFSQMAEKKKEK